MKYALLIGDGMGDLPIPALGGHTPLEVAPTPNLDFMARNGLLGRARTVPEGMPPGSDVAILSLMGYNPQGVLTGRGPLEAASQGLEMAPDETVFRLNLVTLGYDGSQVIMLNHASGNITTEESALLIKALQAELPRPAGQRLFPGVSYRHLLFWPDLDPTSLPSRPPHDYRDQNVTFMLDDPGARPLNDLIRASWPILENHPVNQKRRARNLPPANSIWLWGQGRKPVLRTYKERWGLTGAAVSAVDLIKGLGVVTGLEPIEVPGATGWLDTNYQGKVTAALQALERSDFVVIHLEAPDETSHQGQLDSKLKAIADFDAKVVGPMLAALPRLGDFRILAACDHYTPLSLRTHTSDPVPFILYGRGGDPIKPGGRRYTESEAEAAGLLIDSGVEMGRLLFGPESAVF